MILTCNVILIRLAHDENVHVIDLLARTLNVRDFTIYIITKLMMKDFLNKLAINM